ncbi:complex I intermediate-associated protein 30, mitochondrial [Hetaerina americana]|uniref:complex I intermediate-associated protein 30, mitochondrial n=1 Tax=Hetaerina americana TaxID=62018 RepID=UPI003A7F0FBB
MTNICSSCVLRILLRRYPSNVKQPLFPNSNLISNSLLHLNQKNVCDAYAFGLVKLLHTTEISRTFWERDPRSGYPSTVEIPSKTQLIRNGIKELKKEIQLWKEEVKEKLESDPVVIYRPDELDIFWQFGPPEELSKWVTSSDSDHNQGFSTCELTISRAGKGLFQGNLCVDPPKDGKVKRAGYCNMRSIRAKKSFHRESFHDWQMYTHLVMRVRGDGRPYILNISTAGYFDLFWNDIYSYALYTRGGPYWQISKIPFSKFFLASKGRIQDKQAPITLDRISHFGISLGDKVNGPFRLEIDYIGLEYDPGHTETFAYEMYKVPKYVAAT